MNGQPERFDGVFRALGWRLFVIARSNVPTCLGHYERDDTICDGELDGATEDDKMACAWRDRCGGFRAYLISTGKSVEDYLTFHGEDKATVPDRDEFAEFCKDQADRFNIVEGLPEEPTDEEDVEDEEPEEDNEEAPGDEDNEDNPGDEDDESEEENDEDPDESEDDEGELEHDVDLVESDDDDLEGEDVSNDDDNVQSDDPQGDDAGETATDDKQVDQGPRKPFVKTRKKRKKTRRKSSVRTRPKGERESNSKWAADQRSVTMSIYAHFEEALLEALPDYHFVGERQAAMPGQLYTIDRRVNSGYFTIYCKSPTGRDVPFVSVLLKPRTKQIHIELTVSVKMLQSRLSKIKLKKLKLKQIKGRVFRSRIVAIDKERAAIVAESIQELIEAKVVKLPAPMRT